MRRGAVVLVGAALLTCATEEELLFGDPARVVGGTTTGPAPTIVVTTGPIEDCETADGGPPPTWQYIYTDILSNPAAGACSAGACHGGVKLNGGLVFPAGDAATAYANLVAYKLQVIVGGHKEPRDYIVPGLVVASHFMCNLRVAKGQEHPFIGDDAMTQFPDYCGARMPKTSGEQPVPPIKDGLSAEHITQIAEWIKCGATAE